MDACVIRPATNEDAGAVAEIYRHYVRTATSSFELDPPDTEEIIRRMEHVRNLGLPYLVAEWNDDVVGYAYATQFRPRLAYRFAVEDSLYVGHDRIGRGIGRQLLIALVDRCRDAGAKRMIAAIGGANPASVALHLAYGFELVGVLQNVGFKFDQWLDLTLMQRPL